jgi:hypothetical protein
MNVNPDYSPIGKFIFLTSQNPKVLNGDIILKNELENLVISIKNSVNKYGFEKTEKAIEDKLFALRFEVLEYLKSNPDILDSFENTIVQEIGNKYFSNKKFKDLGSATSDSLEVYLSMFQNIAEEIKNNISNIKPVPSDIKNISLSALRHINALQPNPEFSVVIEWLSASVQYDFYLLVAEFVMSGEILADEHSLNELPGLVKQSIVEFGAYTILSGLWKPSIDEESQLIRNIKIKASAYRLERGLGINLSHQQVNNLLHS